MEKINFDLNLQLLILIQTSNNAQGIVIAVHLLKEISHSNKNASIIYTCFSSTTIHLQKQKLKNFCNFPPAILL